MNRNQILSATVNSWIAEEELPTRANLKVIRQFDDLYPEDEEERQAYFDFIRWAMTCEHLAILDIPKKPTEHDFWEKW